MANCWRLSLCLKEGECGTERSGNGTQPPTSDGQLRVAELASTQSKMGCKLGMHLKAMISYHFWAEQKYVLLQK